MIYDALKQTDPLVFDIIEKELERQRGHLELIASENIVSPAVLAAVSSVLTNKYAEGLPGRRYYQGCEYMDDVENLARERAKELFGCEGVNVQPHSGSQANTAVFLAALEVGDTVLGMDLATGGHLSHGHPKNISGINYKIIGYGVDKETECIDMNEVRQLAQKHKPKLILAGASAYARTIDFNAFADIAEEVGAVLMCDIAHIAGLVATGLHPSPFPRADYVSTTTHKTLRGPRGGMVMAKKKHIVKVNSAVFPGLQGGPLMHVIAGKAVAFQEALQPSFKTYQEQVLKNAQALGKALIEKGYRLVSGGTDNHLVLLDMRSKNINGTEAAELLHSAGITTNQNLIPFDPNPPMTPSGVRLGTPAVTTMGLKENDMQTVADFIDEVITKRDDTTTKKVEAEVKEFANAFKLYEGLKLGN
jgi:glycine hydroxymethyltransferase